MFEHFLITRFNLRNPRWTTSRLDNDDCISRDFIASVQAQFAPNDFLALDFIDGYMLETAPVLRLGCTDSAEVRTRFTLGPAAQQVWERLTPVAKCRLSLRNRLQTAGTLLKRDLKKALGLYRQA
jgi:hypothetical protein